MFEQVIARSWWLLAVRGVVAIIFGITAWAWPGLTLSALVLLFGIYVLADGIFSGMASYRAARADRTWWSLLLQSVLGIVAGALVIAWPGIGALTLAYLIGAWAILTGGSEIAAAIRMRREITGEWLLGLSGVVSILFGLILLLFPGEGALALVWLIGSYAIVFGVLLVSLSLRLRRHGRGGTSFTSTPLRGGIPSTPVGTPGGRKA